MSFDLTGWEGERPESDEIALTVFLSLIDTWQSDDSLEVLEANMRGEKTTHDPTSTIERHVAALLDRWPVVSTDEGADSPWSDGPLIINATGPFFYFGMTRSRAEEASDLASRVASEHGLVCLDPQAEALR